MKDLKEMLTKNCEHVSEIFFLADKAAQRMAMLPENVCVRHCCLDLAKRVNLPRLLHHSGELHFGTGL